jgi:hypothetical protein
MESERRRWRIRISTLMLLVVIAAQAELARVQAELSQEFGRVRRPILRYHRDDGANR